MSDTVRIRNWDKWQSYRSDRGQPPWIKIYRALLRDPEWVALSDAQRGQLVAIWLLAADRDGVIPSSPALVQKLCYLDSPPDFQLLAAHGFIELDAKTTPRRRQDDAPEKRREEKIREEIEVNITDDGFSDFWEIYPKRAGGNPKKEAESRWRSALKRGVLPNDILEGVARYRSFCIATKKVGTEYVMQARTFLGEKQEGWDQDWQITESDRAKVEEVHPSVEFNRKWKAREDAMEAEDAGALEPVGGLTAEIMRRISA